MFEIDISDILSSYVGDTREFEMEEVVTIDDIPDITFDTPLFISLRIVRQAYGVDVVFERLETQVTIIQDDIEKEEVYVYGIARKFHLEQTLEDTDDVSYISSDFTIDLADVIAQEVFISVLR